MQEVFPFLPSALTLLSLGAVGLFAKKRLRAKVLGLSREVLSIPEAGFTRRKSEEIRKRIGGYSFALVPAVIFFITAQQIPFWLFLVLAYDSVSLAAWITIALFAFAAFSMQKAIVISSANSKFPEIEQAQNRIEAIIEGMRYPAATKGFSKRKKFSVSGLLEIVLYVFASYVVIAYRSLWLAALALNTTILFAAAILICFLLIVMFSYAVAYVIDKTSDLYWWAKWWWAEWKCHSR